MMTRLALLLLACCLVVLSCSPKPPADPPAPAPIGVDAAARRAEELRIIETDPVRARLLGLLPWNDEAAPGVPASRPPADLGVEAGKRDLANTATWVGRVGYLAAAGAVVGLVVGSFWGGIGRRSCFLLVGISAGCFFARYFIRVHGFFVSESLSWGLIVGLYVGAGLGLLYLGRLAWARWNAAGVALKRAADADDGRDAIALLPVSQAVRSRLHEAWDVLRGVRSGSLEQSVDLLSRYKLPVPRRVNP